MGGSGSQGVPCRQWPSPCQEAQRSERLLPISPEGSCPDNPIPCCSPCKGHAIPCGLRLVLNYLGNSEPIIISLKEHPASSSLHLG